MTAWSGGRSGLVFKYGLTLVLVALLVFVLFTSIDLGELVTTLSHGNPVLFGAALVTYYVTVPLRTYRWIVLLREVDLELPHVVGNLVVMLSLFFNTILPAKAGDIYKSHVVGIRYDVSRASVLGTTAVERILDVILLSGGLLLSMVVLINPFQEATNVGVVAGVVLTVTVVAVVVLLRIPVRWLPGRVRNDLENFLLGIRSIESSYVLGSVGLLSVVIWGGNVGRIYLLSVALDIGISHVEVIFVALLISFLTGLPYTPAGIGAVEVGGGVALLAFGVTRESGAALLLLDRAITIASVVIVGAVIYTVLHARDADILRGDPLT
ncbi:lysylphosphatidylglycerol synthase transmembrane domain-containing protein [Halorhabdus sp. CUG00001]|uniref:lysylphosphatidylglycerol synthase transmembrane domain-containing protein n=1 Tax=Halorhabdus sp. CUG00001 TaxID=2600297 RepID=UPI00131C021B|nr:lysylphosphatidylglycerol synthase transmembrane domain-containing protein [Halorhabdus sp. CUG00001]